MFSIGPRLRLSREAMEITQKSNPVGRIKYALNSADGVGRVFISLGLEVELVTYAKLEDAILCRNTVLFSDVGQTEVVATVNNDAVVELIRDTNRN